MQLRKSVILGGILAGLMLPGAWAWADSAVGTVTLVDGPANVVSAGGQTRPAIVNGPVAEGDTVVTGANGQVHLRMADDAYLAVRANSRLTLTHYRAPEDGNGESVVNLLKGSFRAVSGWIGKLHPEKYRIQTPTASIGIRGTDHEPLVVGEEEATAELPAGTYDHVNEGETVLEAGGAEVHVLPEKTGFAALRDHPRLLALRPPFFDHPPALDEKLEALKPVLKARIEVRMERFRALRSSIRDRVDGVLPDRVKRHRH